MGIPIEHKGRYFYHFTHIDNIESIVKCRALLSTNLKKQQGIYHHNIASIDIQNRRSEMKVPVGPKGVIHDYVPFYFTSINPMLLGLLNRKVIDQPYICFIAVSIDKILDKNVIFTDASANRKEQPDFYEHPSDLKQLNWKVIDSLRWGDGSEKEKHLRMAEVLIHQSVPLEWIDSFIVFNKIGKLKVEDCYKKNGLDIPCISYDWFNGRPFFFTKFFFENRKNETLITGPIQLYDQYKSAVQFIIEEKRKNLYKEATFENIEHALKLLEENFCALPELEGIYELQTANKMHQKNVGEHTLSVVNNLPNSCFYERLGKAQKDIVKFAAYLHDIGKGPKEKWEEGIQMIYPDHPADAIPMLKRILTEEFLNIAEEEICLICLLVIYHDLMGEIIGKGRSIEELHSLGLDEQKLYMLAALSEADSCAIGSLWAFGISKKLEDLIDKVLR